jgi:hypothetical protein
MFALEMQLLPAVWARFPLRGYWPATQLCESEVQIIDYVALNNNHLLQNDHALKHREVVRAGHRYPEVPLRFVFAMEGTRISRSSSDSLRVVWPLRSEDRAPSDRISLSLYSTRLPSSPSKDQ